MNEFEAINKLFPQLSESEKWFAILLIIVGFKGDLPKQDIKELLERYTEILDNKENDNG